LKHKINKLNAEKSMTELRMTYAMAGERQKPTRQLRTLNPIRRNQSRNIEKWYWIWW